MNTEATLSKQQLKSNATKQKIFKAAEEILQKDGYEALSIKNICELAGVSNGSFYHHFQTKEELLSYYIENQPNPNDPEFDTPTSRDDVIESIVHVYLNYARYSRELGVDFISNFYIPKNEALNPHTRSKRAYPIITVQQYLEQALASHIITSEHSVEEITTDIRMLIIGNVFEWCLNNGDTDYEGNIRRSMTHYLKSILYTVD